MCRCTVLGCPDKPRIGIVRDLIAVNPEWCGVDEAVRLFVGKAIAAGRISHQEFTGRNQQHPAGRKGANGQWRMADG